MEFIENLEVGEKAKNLLRNSGVRSLRAMLSYVKVNESYMRSEIGDDVDKIYLQHKAEADKIVVNPNPPGKLGWNG